VDDDDPHDGSGVQVRFCGDVEKMWIAHQKDTEVF
jgi:hypothetical protein